MLLLRQRQHSTAAQLASSATSWRMAARRIAFQRLQVSVLVARRLVVSLGMGVISVVSAIGLMTACLVWVNSERKGLCAQEIQALRPRTMFVDRVVRPIVNAVYSRGNHVQRLLPLFVAEMARRDKFAACLAGPSIYDHRWELDCSGTN
jgi:hypothetical protein